MPRIAVLLRDWSSRRRDAVSAIYEFARLQPNWTIGLFDHVHDVEQFSSLMAWQPDGLITCLEGAPPEVHLAVRDLAVPLVNLGVAVDGSQSVIIDPQSVIDLASDCLTSLQPRTLILAGSQNHVALANATEKWAAEQHCQFEWLQINISPRQLLNCQSRPSDTLQRFLDHFERPISIVAANDAVAVYVHRLLGSLRVRVPDEASVISIGDSEDCATAVTSLTAIVEPHAEMGLEAAKILQRLLNQPPADRRFLTAQTSGGLSVGDFVATNVGVQPTFVAATEMRFRSSTTDPSVDPSVAIALSFIRENAASGINVHDVVRFLNGRTSRVTFERHFKQVVGVTPGEEIRRVRLDVAKTLLRSTDHDISYVAKQCGFDSASSFSSFFRNGAGASPSAYRRDASIANKPS